MELIKQLTENLGITDEQAKGGAGSIFSMIKGQVSKDDFGKVTEAIPDVSDLLKLAPNGKSGGLLGGITSALGGGKNNIAGLAGGFSKLGLDSDMVGKFVPIILSFVQSKGGDGIKNILSGVLK